MSSTAAAGSGEGDGRLRLPRVLVDPPWAAGPPAQALTVVPGLVCPDPPTIRWEPGERDAWLAMATAVRGTAADPVGPIDPVGGSGLVGGAGPDWGSGPGGTREASPGPAPGHEPAALLVTVAQRELAALPAALAAARRAPARCACALAPLASTEVATFMAELLATRPVLRQVTTAWFGRHAQAAARALLPAALSRPGRSRWRAWHALLALAAAGHGAAVTAAAAGHGGAAAQAAGQLLATDPADLPPLRVPAVPVWADPGTLPAVRLAAGGVLPRAAVDHLITVLALSRMDDPHPALGAVLAACDRASLAGFGWELFERWRAAGGPGGHGWAMHALGLAGDDGTAGRLARLIPTWPARGWHVRAATGVAALAAIGSDVALTQLDTIARRAGNRRLRELAAARLRHVAAARGLRPEQLPDRIVPRLGLDRAGRVTVDYGQRRFTVGFDERLRPVVTDPAGRRLTALPRPAAGDDPALAPPAYRGFQALAREARAVARHQIGRLERAMVVQRRWRFDEFRELVIDHPLLWHLVHRLVLVHPSGAVRVAEDHTLADLNDRPVLLADATPVGIAHPLHLGGDRAAWAQLLADYEILQPFAQLAREVVELSGAERRALRLGRHAGSVVATRRLLGLERRGWRRAEPGDGGVQGWIERDAPDGSAMVVDLDPGISVCDVDLFPEQALEEIWVCGPGDSRWGPERGTPVGHLDPITLSEALCDLRWVTG